VFAGATGNCEDGFSCAYLTNLAWSGPTTFLPKETNPRAVFERLTKDGLPQPGAGSSQPSAAGAGAKARAYQRAILDRVAQDTRELQRNLGRSDRDKLNEYLESVNELERRIAALEQASGMPVPGANQCQSIAAPKDGTYLGRDGNNVYEYPELLSVMNDLIAFALQCDLTRVITFMSEIPLNTQTNFSFLGVNSSDYHGSISHHGGDSEKLMSIQTVNTFYAEQFAYLLGKLAGMTDSDGSSVLDNSILLFTSEFGDGDNHYHFDLPVVVAGGGGGSFKTGRHIAYPSQADRGDGAIETARRGDTPLANLYISILQAFGLNMTTFGSVDGTTPYGTQPLAELSS